MDLQFFNTLSRRIETFEPSEPSSKKVGLYCCGPTVYDFAHIGNFRTFLFVDMVRRFLEFKGFEVNHVMNITDVDDKIIHGFNASPEKTSLRDYTAPYEKAFFEDFDQLNCLRPTSIPRATDYIPQMLELIGKLMENGIAYQTPDGSIFFSIQRYIALGGKYGQLVKINFDEIRVGERIKSDEYEKENVADFVLWKARVPSDGELFWPSPWGEGRPGWHIECSAMSRHILGKSFDIHLGGEDLAFPHHEDEIAQSEGSTLCKEGGCKPTPFVRYWLHFSHLLVEGKKMSKSLGNFYTVRDLFQKGYSGREVRYLLLSAHYRESFNFTLEGLNGARTALARLDECLFKLRELAGTAEPPGKQSALVQSFDDALSDDFNLSAGWAALFDWVRQTNKQIAEEKLSPADAAGLLADWARVDSVLAVCPQKKEEEEVPTEITDLLEARQAARKAKDFARSDAIRDELKSKGWVIEDTPKGARLKRL
ncbi:MAG: cysteine--tRNA ligase [Limisphaerales bacterium]|jgi:cysteinyl-tRNA synthetase